MAFGKKRKDQEAEAAQSQLSQYASDPMSRYSRNSEVYAQKKEAILESYSRNNTTNYSHKRAKRGKRGKKVALGFAAVVVVALVGVGAYALMFMNEINSALGGNYTAQEQQEIKEALAQGTSFNDVFYVLLLGSDSRDANDFTGSRSDTNILTRVDPVNKVVTMVSIPRDTKIELEGYGTQKFNAARAYGGVAGVIREASKLCGVEISHYVEIGFDGVMNLVDSIGGVDVDVPYEIHDDDAWVDNEAGYQTLSGWDALGFARSRAYADGDFTRTSNQRLLIKALVDKVLALDPVSMQQAIKAGAACVDTDMSLMDVVGLANTFKDGFTMYSAMVPSTTAYIDDVSYVICDEAGLKEMMKVVEAGGDPSPVQTSGATSSSLN